MEEAIRIAHDVQAMLADGEHERASYNLDDLKLALPRAPEVVALSARLEVAFAHAHYHEAHALLQRLLQILPTIPATR